MGDISPKMGGKSKGLVGALFPRTRQRVLEVLMAEPGHTLAENAIVRMTGSGVGGTRRELARLVAAGIVRCEQAGREKLYRANRDSPIYRELKSIVCWTADLRSILRSSLATMGQHIQLAYVLRPLDDADETADAPICVVVVTEALEWDDVHEALADARRRLARPLDLDVRDLATDFYRPGKGRRLRIFP